MFRVKSARFYLSSATDLDIKYQSYGKVRVDKTYNEKELVKVRVKKVVHPEPDGLFCEKIFGPVLSYVCKCDIDLNIANSPKLYKCSKCGVEYTTNYTRRNRFSYIETPIPYLNPLSYKILGKLLNVNSLNLFKKWLVKGSKYSGIYLTVVEDDNGTLESNGVLYSVKINVIPKDCSENERQDILNNNIDSVYSLYSKLIYELKAELVDIQSIVGKKYAKKIESILDIFNFYIPVMPPFYRDIKELDTGSHSYGEENIAYKQILILSKMLKYGEHYVLKNQNTIASDKFECLQFYIKTLFLGGDITSENNTKKKIISPIQKLSKKDGLVRGSLVGKRVDFSGRSFIVIDPTLDIDTVGLPFDLFYKLAKPFIINKILQISSCSMKDAFDVHYDLKTKLAIKATYEAVKGKVVLMNRAPSLHRYSIMAFKVTLHNNKCIKLPNLVLTPFNADCILEDQEIHTVDFGRITVPELIDKKQDTFSVFSIDSKGKRVIGVGHSPRYIRTVSSYMEIFWDNGLTTKCTDNHKFLLDEYKNGLKYIKACDLKPNVSGVYSSHPNNGKPVYPVSIKTVNKKVDVFDITVEDHHNYALSSGVICHNCDGDTMGVHLVITDAASKEAMELMSPVNNLLSSADFDKPNIVPSHEGIAGAYILTTEDKLS